MAHKLETSILNFSQIIENQTGDTELVNIARSLEEAETQLEIGRAVIASDQDDIEDNYASSKAVAAMDNEKAADDDTADEAEAEETLADDNAEETADDNA